MMSPFLNDRKHPTSNSTLDDTFDATTLKAASSKAASSFVTLADPACSDYDYNKGQHDDNVEEKRQEEEKRLIKTLDWHILPLFCIFYFVDFLDRANIGNATYVS